MPAHAADIEGAPPVFVVGGEPFVTGVAVGPELVELGRGPGGPAKLEFDHTAASDQTRLNQRAEDRRHRLVAQAGQRAGVRCVAGYRCYAARITSATSKSGKPPETSRRRSRRRAASAAALMDASGT